MERAENTFSSLFSILLCLLNCIPLKLHELAEKDFWNVTITLKTLLRIRGLLASRKGQVSLKNSIKNGVQL